MKKELHDYIEKDAQDCEFLRAPKINSQPTQILCPNDIVTTRLIKKLGISGIEHEVWNGKTNSKFVPEERKLKRSISAGAVTDFNHYPR